MTPAFPKPGPRRAPMKPGQRRRKGVTSKRSKPRRSGRVRDRAYLLAVKGLPCCLALLGNCLGPVQAHHAGRHPVGRKADDSTAIPLCAAHHDGLHGRRVALRWLRADGTTDDEAARPWQDRMIAETRARLGWKEARNAVRAAELEEQMRSIATPAGRCQFLLELLHPMDEHGNPAPPLISKELMLRLLMTVRVRRA